MQALFTSDELQLLLHVLEERDRELILEIAHTDHAEFKHRLQQMQSSLATVARKLTEGESEFGDDDRNLLVQVLNHYDVSLFGEISRTDHHDFKTILQAKQAMVERIAEKITGVAAVK